MVMEWEYNVIGGGVEWLLDMFGSNGDGFFYFSTVFGLEHCNQNTPETKATFRVPILSELQQGYQEHCRKQQPLYT